MEEEEVIEEKSALNVNELMNNKEELTKLIELYQTSQKQVLELKQQQKKSALLHQDLLKSYKNHRESIAGHSEHIIRYIYTLAHPLSLYV